MSSKQQAERLDTHTTQREKEREKRRLRDRLRRQNMSQEQREKHLARRRRNYQLRRLRAQNSNQQTDTPDLSNDTTEPKIQEEAQKKRKYPRRLRLSEIRHLARTLHCDGNQQIQEVSTSCADTKRLRLTHVKRLARALNLTMK
ncbi:uncharacterized protein LOC104900869 [Beta vulgaris subsp. vulgaris]|uniref:uncharacterized protein LOC104900869 n=1 Tax=Beta vulgaris subsp. vulgaris TaxID=3555 RepID=UPI00053FD5CD|nr:uncharacterized protein LOC104900869 [Beta vulgaris subsp. vulgaris]